MNLLQNAVRHGPVGNRIALSLCRDGTGASISVTESAPDIPPEDRDKVPTAFYWCDDVHATEGNGPGLALVKSTADRHEARLTLSENLPGLRVTIRFPQTLNI